MSDETGGRIEFTDDNELIIQTEDQLSTNIVRGYVDTKTKTLTVGLSGEGSLDPEIEQIIQAGSYNYNVEQDTLTLTEREYGDQLVFVRAEE